MADQTGLNDFSWLQQMREAMADLEAESTGSVGHPSAIAEPCAMDALMFETFVQAHRIFAPVWKLVN